MLHQMLIPMCGHKLTLASNVTDSANRTLQDDLDNFVHWSKNNNLTRNTSKCQGLQVCFMQALQHQLCLLMMFLLTLLIIRAKILAFDCRMIGSGINKLQKCLRRPVAACMLRNLKRFGFNSAELGIIY